jgi:hypothetical protein
MNAAAGKSAILPVGKRPTTARCEHIDSTDGGQRIARGKR